MRSQGVLDLPQLRDMALYSARFSMLDIRCPMLTMLSISLEGSATTPELADLPRLTTLQLLHLCDINEELDLRPLTSLRYAIQAIFAFSCIAGCIGMRVVT